MGFCLIVKCSPIKDTTPVKSRVLPSTYYDEHSLGLWFFLLLCCVFWVGGFCVGFLCGFGFGILLCVWMF